jgi:preprotein translocase subunit SecD
LSEEVAPGFAQDMRNYGFTTNQAYSSQCGEADLQPGNYCLLTVRDNRTVYSAVMAEGLGSQIATGEFEKDPRFIITATNASEARQLYVDMRAGSLPTRLTIQDTFFVDPSLGTEFRGRSFLTGLVAVLAVSLVVFFRYGEFKVAFPMLVTALSEVAILLGFAATVPLALNLSHIAGLIAVIGTGVDDLIIIADEVMTEEVSSDRVFRNRFRKALWIIGAAAATTIIAMSPLAVLSLGDLRGFAIVTILGVLIGVIITRPAYGDILRRLLTDQH